MDFTFESGKKSLTVIQWQLELKLNQESRLLAYSDNLSAILS